MRFDIIKWIILMLFIFNILLSILILWEETELVINNFYQVLLNMENKKEKMRSLCGIIV